MNSVVGVQEIVDPDAPSDSFRLDPDQKVLVASPKVSKVLNPFDEQAVEAALRIKDGDADVGQ
jgi:electron transfer flavoprotein beta subunit